MSFDLIVYFQPSSMTARQAKATVAHALKADDYSALTPHPNLTAFHAALSERYPALETLSDAALAASPWSMTPALPDPHIHLAIRHPASRAMAVVVRELADSLGLAVYDPQGDQPKGKDRPKVYGLRIGKSPTIVDPHPKAVASLIRHALTDGLRAVFERGPDLYLQTGSRPGSSPEFAVEYRNGSADEHFRYETTDMDEVLSIFDNFARRDDAYRTRVTWQRLES